MPRGRMIKPDFWSDGNIAKLSNNAKLLFIAMWNFADDVGVLENSNRKILGNVFPFDESITEKHIEKWKQELISRKLLKILIHKENEYLHIINFLKHQKIDRPSKTKCIETLDETLDDSINDEVEIEVEVEDKKKSKKEIAISVEIAYPDWFDDNLKSVFEEYLLIRKKIKVPNTDNVLKRLFNKLELYSGKNKLHANDVILNAINSAWKDFYALKDGNGNEIIPKLIIEKTPEELAEIAKQSAQSKAKVDELMNKCREKYKDEQMSGKPDIKASKEELDRIFGNV